MQRTVFVFLAAILLAGCEAGGAILLTSAGTGLLAGAATERVLADARRDQPITVIGPVGRVLAVGAGKERQIAPGALDCRADIPDVLTGTNRRELVFPLTCRNGAKATGRLRADHGQGVLQTAVAVAPDRQQQCQNTFLFRDGVVEPFGIDCRETYKAPCGPDGTREGVKCSGDLGTSFKVQFHPRKSDGAAVITPVGSGLQLRVWMNPLSDNE